MSSEPTPNVFPHPSAPPAKREEPGGLRALVARLVWAHHLAIFAFIAVAWALPWSWALWAALVFYPLVQLNWLAFGNRCVLTILEEKLRRSAAPAANEESLHFVQDLGGRLLGRPVSRVWADALSYGFVWGGFAIAGLRLYLRGG